MHPAGSWVAPDVSDTYVVGVECALDAEISDDELAALALAADPDVSLDPDAVPITIAAPGTPGLLPEWYMPAPMSTARGRARRLLLGVLVVALVVINGAGLCVTFGIPELAW
jgi:hypothetical protein